MIDIDKQNQIFHLSSPAFSYVLKVQDGQLFNLYWGAPLAHADLDYLLQSFSAGSSFALLTQRLPHELPSVGTGWYGEAALQAENAAGNHLTCLQYQDYRLLDEKPALQGLPHVHQSGAETLVLVLRDPLTGL